MASAERVPSEKRNSPAEFTRLDITKLRRTTRISKTCLSCKKRKVKCNFEVPCDKCIARNKGHLCSREPVIVDGVVINNAGDEKLVEMKFAQENEVLKRKIKDLERTVFKLRSEFSFPHNSNSAAVPRSSGRKAFSFEPSGPHGGVSLELSTKWDSYSVVISLLNKGLAEGLQDDDDQNFDANTEEWSRIPNKELMKSIRSGDEKSDVWNYQLRLIANLNKTHSDLILESALRLSFLHNVLDNDRFLQEYESYWNDPSIIEKHITPYYSKSSKEYLFLAQYYMLLCIGVYYSDDTLQQKLAFSDETLDLHARSFFACGLECLFRGRYMTFPSIGAIQFFSLLKLCAHPLGGVHLQNCLVGTMCYSARKLKLDCVAGDSDDPETDMKLRWWWSLVNVDWYEDQFRYSLIAPGTFCTPKPRKWKIPHKVLDWDNYYQRFVAEIATIKRNYYFDDTVLKSELTLQSLEKADLELRVLEITIRKDFENYMDHERLTADPHFSTTVEFIKFLTDYIILQERLDINSKMSRFMTYEHWTSDCYELCCNCAETILKRYADPRVPNLFKKPWFVCELAVSAAVFLLVDAMLNKQTASRQKSVISAVKKIMPVLGSHKLIVRPAVRGLYVLQKLINLMVAGDRRGSLQSIESITKMRQAGNTKDPQMSKTQGSMRSKAQSKLRKQLKFINYSSVSNPSSSDARTEDRHLATPQAKFDKIEGPARLDISDVPLSTEQSENPFPEVSGQVPELHTAILDILGDHGWGQFLDSIDEFNMTFDV
ncbi:hypothetical protein KL904_001487 [Ogataea polymorpha]|nr:hypothetical protein KL904_001487 [Ogataea polymorpha]